METKETIILDAFQKFAGIAKADGSYPLEILCNANTLWAGHCVAQYYKSVSPMPQVYKDETIPSDHFVIRWAGGGMVSYNMAAINAMDNV